MTSIIKICQYVFILTVRSKFIADLPIHQNLLPKVYIMSLIQQNFSGSNTDGSFTMAISNLFLSTFEISHGCRIRISKGDFLFLYLKMVYCVYSLESPYRGHSNENAQYTFILQTLKIYPYYAS